jgi:ABC-type dipeptide/oligopeptide/nickel transport system permease subunit
MDIVFMQIAIAEMLTFPNIPVSVTINEYVDFAKLYSTPKSGGYINGMLDTYSSPLDTDMARLMKSMHRTSIARMTRAMAMATKTRRLTYLQKKIIKKQNNK